MLNNYPFRSRVFFLLLVMLPYIFFSQFSFLKNFKNEAQLIDSVASHQKELKDVKQISDYIARNASILKITNRYSIQIIQDVFKANKQVEILQKYNKESTTLYKNAVQQANLSNRKELQIWTNINYGYYLYTYRHLKEALPYFIKCEQDLRKIPEEKIIQPDTTYRLLGFFLMTAMEYERSNEFLEKATQFTAGNDSETAAILNNIGLNYISLNNLEKAEIYFNKSLDLAEKSNDKLRYAKVLGSLGTVKFKQKNYSEAEKFFLKDIEISEKIEDKNTMFALINLTEIYMAEGKDAAAETALKRAENIALSQEQFKSSELEIAQLFQKIAEKNNDKEKDLFYRKRADVLTLELERLDGENNVNHVNWETQKENLQYQLSAEKAKKERNSYIAAVVILFFTLLLVILFYAMKSSRNKWKIEKANYEKVLLSLALDKEKSENRLNSSEQTVDSFKIFIQEKNQQIERLEYEISNAQNSSTSRLEMQSEGLQKLLESHLMTQENWEKFRFAYQSEYPTLYQKLTENFPDLTESNQRITFLSSLDITNNEMARVLGVTVDAIKKAKQRLRKKYGTDFEIYLSGSN